MRSRFSAVHKTPLLALFLALLGLGWSNVANASGADLFGLGPVSAAQSGAVSASCGDFSCTYYNPSGLPVRGRVQVALGLSASRSSLEIQNRHASIAEPLAVLFGLTAPAPLKGALRNRIGLGIALSIVPTKVARVVAHLPDEPFLPYYENRSQRLLLLPGVSVRVNSRVQLGVAVNFLAGLGGNVRTADGATRALEPRVDVAIFSTARINAGARIKLPARFEAAVTYRQAFSVPFSVVTENRVANDDINLAIDAEGLQSPHTFVVGTTWRSRGERVQIGADAGLALWSNMRAPYVAVTSRLPFVGPLEGTVPEVNYRDAYSIRTGASIRAITRESFEVTTRFGAWLETSPVGPQPGVTNLVDGLKSGMTLGGGVRLGKVGQRAITFDAHLGLTVVARTTHIKRLLSPTDTGGPAIGLRDELPDQPSDPATHGIQISNPGYPNLSGGGSVLSASVAVGVSL